MRATDPSPKAMRAPHPLSSAISSTNPFCYSGIHTHLRHYSLRSLSLVSRQAVILPLLLLFLIISSIPSTSAIVLPISSIGLNTTIRSRIYRFGTFAFYKGGEVSIDISSLIFTSTGSVNISDVPKYSYTMVCREDDVFSIDTIVASSQASINSTLCDIPTLSNQCPYIKSFSELTNTTQGGVNIKHQLVREGYYSTFVVMCKNRTGLLGNGVKAWYTNPGPNYVRHLSAIDVPVLNVHLVFLGLWVVINVVWFGHYYTMRHMSNLLHFRLSLIPFVMLLNSSVAVGFLVNLGTGGYKSESLETLRFFLLIIHILLIYVMLQLMSKGWYIVRKRLAGVEKRTIGGMALFVALGNAFFQFMGGGSVIAILIFLSTVHIYMFWNLRYILEAVTDYLRTLRDRLPSPTTPPTSWSSVVRPPVNTTFASKLAKKMFQGPPGTRTERGKVTALGKEWDLVNSYAGKLWLLGLVNRIITFFTIGIFMLVATQYFTQNYTATRSVADFEYPYIGVFLSQTFLVLGISWMGIVMRLRDPVQYVVVPSWVAGSGRRQNGMTPS
ncbi:hypothetical protein BC829DRAFT_378794 [Chytridium lagenaria]|nr:hypothetical protein BC829DRAFT_378794 [Chytridium lagenaria]